MLVRSEEAAFIWFLLPTVVLEDPVLILILILILIVIENRDIDYHHGESWGRRVDALRLLRLSPRRPASEKPVKSASITNFRLEAIEVDFLD